MAPFMAFIESYRNGYRIYSREGFQGTMEWFLRDVDLNTLPPFHHSRHSVVNKVSHPLYGALFVKSFVSEHPFGMLKDSFRGSRAYRSWKAGEMLRQKGLLAPEVVEVAERKRFGLISESFLITTAVNGTILKDLFGDIRDFHAKRGLIREIGRQIGRMHALGILHGDLLPGNIFVVMEEGRPRICLLDNESTRKVSSINMGQRIKNLVQLNRVVLPRITATDRVRFFDAYLKENPSLNASRDELLRKIGEVTSERVMRHRGLTPEEKKTTTFRALMAWEK